MTKRKTNVLTLEKLALAKKILAEAEDEGRLEKLVARANAAREKARTQ